MAIIGISGRIGSGKDTVGKIIQYLIDKHGHGFTNPDTEFDFQSYINVRHDKHSSWKIKKFAYALKQVCSILTGIPIEDFEKQEVKDRVLGEEWRRWHVIVRLVNDYGTYYTIKRFATEKEGNAFKATTDGTIIESGTNLITVRELLQQVGTDAMRNIVHPNVWVNALMSQYKGIECTSFPHNAPIFGIPTEEDEVKYGIIGLIEPDWIITDVRFPNEAVAIKERSGIVIRVNRDLPCPVCKLTKYEQRGEPCKNIACPKGRADYIGKHPSEIALDDYPFDYFINNNGSIEELIKEVKYFLTIKEIL